jgi:hypothetical protein
MSVASFAQQTQASLTGQISDPQGATIANADVTITDVETAISRTVPSNGSGRYTVTNLNPGNYSVSVKAAGFSEKVLKGIVLAVGQQGSLDVAMTLGSASDVVTVNAEAAVTDTESSSQGAVIDNKEVVGLPLNQRTFYSLALLTPGVTIPGQASTLGFRGGFNVAGNNETANTFTINGIDDNDQNVMAPSFRPSVEAIEEFKMLTGVYSAEYGRTSGGQVVVITKRGTNAFHGDVFEFLRNSQFDAKNYFTRTGTPTTFRRNQFGGTIGGPIIKDKAFFFLSYEGLRLAQPVVGNTNVPNPAFQTGNFAAVCTSGFTAGVCNTSSQQLVNPVTKVAFANNQIPASMLSPLGVALLKLYPSPNAGYSASTPNPGFTLNTKRVENLDEGSARVDYNLTSKDSLLVQYNYFNDPSFEPSNSLCGSALIPGFGCTTNQISTLAGINWTHILNDHWLNEFRIGYDRLEQPRTGQDVNNAAANAVKIGGAFSDPTVSSTINGGAPYTTVSGFATIHPYTNLPQHRWDNHYNLVDNVSWSHGKHNAKFGVNILQARYVDIFVSYGTGGLSFTPSQYETTGYSAGDLATGYAYTATRVPTAPNFAAIYSSYGGYALDDWKITPTLTLNLGLRYEYFSPTSEAHGVMSNYVLPTGFNRAANSAAGTIEVQGQGGVGSKLYNGDLNNFAPRIGFSYQPFGNAKTVVHGTYGIFYNSPAIGNGANLSMSINPPFRLSQSFTSPTSLATCPLTRNAAGAQIACPSQIQIDTQPFTAGVTPTGTQGNPFPSTAPTGIDKNFRTLYMDEWGASIDRQITPTMVLTVGYLGNAGVKIPRPVQVNQAVVTGITSNSAGTQTGTTSYRPLSSTLLGPVANPLGTFGGAPLYYQLSNPTLYISEGHSNYHQLSVKAQQNYNNGLSFVFAFTWSHAIDNAPGYASTSQASSGTPQDSFNLKAEKGTSDFNVGKRLVISPVYELPFGKGKKFLTNGIGGVLAGGWQLSGIYTFDSGRPFTISTSTNRSGSTYGNDRPNVIGNPNSGPKTVAQWFNTAAFTANAVGTFGNAGRNIVVGPHYNDTDFSIQRMFDVTERYKITFRAEAFDIFNNVNFLNPLGTGTGQYIPAGFVTPTTANPNPVQSYANTNSSFGSLTAANDPRSLQFSMKLLF